MTVGVRLQKSPTARAQPFAAALLTAAGRWLSDSRSRLAAAGANLFLCDPQVMSVWGIFPHCPSRCLTGQNCSLPIPYLLQTGYVLPGAPWADAPWPLQSQLAVLVVSHTATRAVVRGFCGLGAHFCDPFDTGACDCRTGCLAESPRVPTEEYLSPTSSGLLTLLTLSKDQQQQCSRTMGNTDLLSAAPLPKGEWVFILSAVYFCILLRRVALRPVLMSGWKRSSSFFHVEITEARSDATEKSLFQSFEEHCSPELGFLK